MKSGVRIVKRADNQLQSLQSEQIEKTAHQNEREIVSTVKSWISELAQRRQADEHIARTRFFAAAH